MSKATTESKEKPNITVAISDFALATASFTASAILIRGNIFSGDASNSMLLIGLAATAGTFRFLGMSQVIFVHDYLTDMSPCFALPLLALALFGLSDSFILKLGLCQVFVILYFLRKSIPVVFDAYRKLMAFSSLAALFCKSLMALSSPHLQSGSAFGIVGALLYVAGSAFGAKGTLWGCYRVNFFHYALALANISIAFGVREILG